MTLYWALDNILTTVASSPFLQQLLPLAVVILVPLLILSSQNLLYSSALSFVRMLGSLSSTFPWAWGYGHSPGSSVLEKTQSKGKHVRTRAQQLAQNGTAHAGMSLSYE